MSTYAARKNTFASAKKVIFNAPAVAARLGELQRAADDGKEDAPWWAPALRFEWASARKGNNGTQWVSVYYTDELGVKGRLIVRVNGERHTGQIMPTTDAGVAEMARTAKNPNMKIEKRTKKPAIQIQKWAASVKTCDDGVTVQCDADGQPMLPGDDALSAYYQVAALVGEAFAEEAKERIDRGLALVAKASELRRANKAVGAQAVADAFASANGLRRPGDMVLATESAGNLRKIFPVQKDVDLLTRGAIFTSNVKVTRLVQEYISDQAKRNAGCPLPNPMTRIAMNFDGTTGAALMAFFDKGAPYVADGRQKYDAGKVEGEPVNADNVHKFVLSRSTLDGIINMDSICFSNMGVSMPVKAEVLVVDKPTSREVCLDDVYDDDDLTALVSGPAPSLAPAPTPAPTPSLAPVRAPANSIEENYDELLSELSV
jgi:hypothetical protein